MINLLYHTKYKKIIPIFSTPSLDPLEWVLIKALLHNCGHAGILCKQI